MVPRVSALAISERSTDGTPLATPTPNPDTNRPKKRAYRLPEADIAAPMMKNALLASNTMRLPCLCEGSPANILPIHAPNTVKDVANEASTTNNIS